MILDKQRRVCKCGCGTKFVPSHPNHRFLLGHTPKSVAVRLKRTEVEALRELLKRLGADA